MIPELREAFNAAFTDERYRAYQTRLERDAGCPIEFRLAETPVFLPLDVRDEIVRSGSEILSLLASPEHQAYSKAAVPEPFNAPRCDEHPLFLQVDFALTRDPNRPGLGIAPKLIELQGFPSIYAFQLHQGRALATMSPTPERLGFLLSGLDEDRYVAILGAALLGGHAPQDVVLLELQPERQKTLPDFRLTERLWGVRTVDAATVSVRGRELWYDQDLEPRRIRRVYSRIVPEELQARRIELPFRFTDDLDVEWAGHPNWYFRWSKHSLPWLRHPAVPEAHLLSEMNHPPDDLADWVLKPLFGYAGSGVLVDVAPRDVEAVPETLRSQVMLMRKIAYEPLIQTVDGQRSKVEVRLMLVWPPGESAPTPLTTLARLSQGKMMGVDFNRDRTWVGSSICLWPVR